MKRVKAVLVTILFLTVSVNLLAHGVNVETSFQGKAVVLRSSFSPTQPLSDAVVTIYSPADAENSWQTGRTDKTGHFAFLPDTDGDWIFVVDDQKGHMKRTTISVSSELLAGEQPAEEVSATAEKTVSATSPPSGLNKIHRVIIGLSLIFGLTGIFYGFKARQNQNQQ